MINIDMPLVTAHTEKENSAGTYKGGYGFAPMIASVDYGKENGTGEILAAMLRPGNKGANSAKDHITVLAEALAQLPDQMHDGQGNLAAERILVRTDSARGLPRIPAPPALLGTAVLHLVRAAGAQRAFHRLDQ
ncbi:hypothetical protein JOF47_000539 [Paeniglutamicibacter kerguelensis]|uniref:Transposase DDE domain-containing protein n=1 Tax=Paeniglutamicibacter kerguelensis TaxID=254788 RepID=A0ABS4X9W1_9MICC|nr:hypothetical protein [Paeniglutamicibacter kerguelensis]